MTGDITITGAARIEQARWLTVRAALKLEIQGLRRSRGRSARQLANEITGRNWRTARQAYAALNTHIAAAMGPAFDKPLLPAPAGHAPVSVLNRSGRGIRTVVTCSCKWVPAAADIADAGGSTMNDAHAAHRHAQGLPPADYTGTVFGEGPWAGWTWDDWYAVYGGRGLDPYTGQTR
jgi:hypothetical protein